MELTQVKKHGFDHLELDIDMDCQNCRTNFATLLDTKKSLTTIHLRPDYNCHGILTHWHICLYND